MAIDGGPVHPVGPQASARDEAHEAHQPHKLPHKACEHTYYIYQDYPVYLGLGHRFGLSPDDERGQHYHIADEFSHMLGWQRTGHVDAGHHQRNGNDGEQHGAVQAEEGLLPQHQGVWQIEQGQRDAALDGI